jgi:hypothetical protein
LFRSVDDIGERLAIPEPQRFAGHVISSRLYCSPKALWKLNWFLRDFGYDAELRERDEVDEKQLAGVYWELRRMNRKFIISHGVAPAMLYYPRPLLRRNPCERQYFCLSLPQREQPGW